MAYNPLNNHAYVVSRASGVKVAILDGDTGAELGFLNVGGITGGTFALSTITVSGDGSIYAANLTTGSATSPYKIYRWADESSAPIVVYSGNPSGGANNNRYGDCPIDARGSGIDTELITSAQSNPIAILFRPTDASLATFTSTRLDVAGLPGAADLTKGIGFGVGNSFYGKNNGNTTVRYCTYDPALGTATYVSTFNVASVAPIDVDPVRNLLAGADCANNTTTHNLRVYDLSSGSSPAAIFSTAFPTPYTANANAVGEVQIAGDRIIAIDTQNGIVMAKIYINNNPIPPGITQQPPTNSTVLEGGYLTISMSANGTQPLYYQWLHDGTPISGANTNFLSFTNIAMSQGGNYQVVVTNAAGSITSNPSILTVNPSVRTPVLEPLWRLSPGDRTWLTTDNNQRGIAYNPTTGHLLVVSRSPSNAVFIVDAATGDELGTLNVDPTVINGGTFVINLIGVADDGSIYVANLTTGAASTPLKIYRWEFEDTVLAPTLFYTGDPTSGQGGANSVRWGDNMDVRGTSAGTIQILLGSRNGDKAAIISQTGGGAVTSTMIDTDAPDGGMGLGVAFGAGDTFWAKSTTFALRQIGFNGTTLHTYGTSVFPSLIGPINVDAANNYLAGLSIDTPDTIQLFNVADLANPPLWVDTEFFPTDNANANGTGALDFGPNLLFALDSNNGLMAFALQSPPTITCPPNKTVECSELWTFDLPEASDPCDGNNVAVIAYSTTTNALCGSTYTATRIWRATNNCGNMAQCSQTVTVTDTIAPSIFCVENKTAECGAAWTFDEPTALDACGTATVNVVSTVTNAVQNGLAITRTWTAADGCGNTSEPCSQTVTVPVDAVAPMIACPANITTACAGAGGTTVTFSVTATDACDANPVVTCVPASGSSFNVGTTTVNCEAADASGNKSNCSFTVTVTDSSPAPLLTIERQGNTITITWPESCTSYNLMETTSLTPPITWSASSATITSSNGKKVATTTNAGDNKFFILKSQN